MLRAAWLKSSGGKANSADEASNPAEQTSQQKIGAAMAGAPQPT